MRAFFSTSGCPEALTHASPAALGSVCVCVCVCVCVRAHACVRETQCWEKPLICFRSEQVSSHIILAVDPVS